MFVVPTSAAVPAKIVALRNKFVVGCLRRRPVGATMVFIHGGGFTQGFDPHHQVLTALFARHLGVQVLTLEYPLAAPVEAVHQALEQQLHRIVSIHGSVILAGDSAGGNLAIAMALAHPEWVQSVVAICPWLDLTLRHVDPVHAAKDPVIGGQDLQTAAQAFAGSRALDDPTVSPLFDQRPLPPTCVVSGGCDMLAPDSFAFAARSEVTHVHSPTGFHVYLAAAHTYESRWTWKQLRRWWNTLPQQ